MKVAFRADASPKIGTGHIMRCLTLANGLAARGHDCCFFVRSQPGDHIDHIRNCGFPVYEVHRTSHETGFSESETPYLSWLGCTPAEDARACQKAISQIKPDWIVLDHYSLDSSWTSTINSDAKALVIDDLANRTHDCDILLDQTLGRASADYSSLVPNHCNILCGAEYALLRPEFSDLRSYSINRRKNRKIKTILISLGGVDKDNITGKIINALASTEFVHDCHFVVILGSSSPWIEEIKSELDAFPGSSELQINVTKMAALMAESDLAIGAGGSTSWERCCLGLPTIMIVLAENQRKVAFELEQYGAVVLIKELTRIQDELKELYTRISSSNMVEKLSKKSSEVTDGKGCSKVIKVMEVYSKAN
ncbi:UDP-2,4-diacetamido-2,4,6-trideoxy-beta-L-altropyranose hydrolase [Billgrantia montanilacus]|uniref:UDP-2,4-diacetamido-2,4, 6-trideoxy-beta-L-altropyranose hydrolase n=1 Tax=Billgrantia montanilacus TaxID=2282305 RepID=A0A368TX78_9GAMM|nr:UDP-2,4-diacetamido-2,4,6-trideoxy-beta-L-altropyranose hydrolase [Halomonas montanilacus]RCV89375.1 UDP-2,4-diacetamido-2,4,6-trideoxy-beta-L-altropyranose hydrolase [Halomonas montanilacus]